MNKQYWFLYFENVIAENKISGDGGKYNGKSQQDFQKEMSQKVLEFLEGIYKPINKSNSLCKCSCISKKFLTALLRVPYPN